MRGIESILLLLLVCAMSIAALALATRQINISQGRLLYPMMIGFAPLLMLGWRGLLGRWHVVVIVPLALLTAYTGIVTLPASFTLLERVESLPADVRRIDARAESLTLLGYRLHELTAAPGQVVHLDVYFSGRHADNPALFVKLLDPVTLDTLGGIDVYPGMSPTDELAPEGVYHAPVAIFLDPAQAGGRQPMQVKLVFGWRVPEPERFLPWVDGNGTPLDLLTVPGFTLIDPATPLSTPQIPTDVTFGEMIQLVGYSITPHPPSPSPTQAERGGESVGTRLASSAADGTSPVPTQNDKITAAPGDGLSLAFFWRALKPIDADYTLTLALVDADGHIVAQADAMPPGYPTSAWRENVPFIDARALTIPPDAPPGEYDVYVGWYLAPDGGRLHAVGDNVRDDLYFLPTPLSVR